MNRLILLTSVLFLTLLMPFTASANDQVTVVDVSSAPQQLPLICVNNATHAHGALHIMGGWIVPPHGFGDGPHNVDLRHFSEAEIWKATDKITVRFKDSTTFRAVAVGFSGFDAPVCLEELLALMATDNSTIIWSGP